MLTRRRAVGASAAAAVGWVSCIGVGWYLWCVRGRGYYTAIVPPSGVYMRSEDALSFFPRLAMLLARFLGSSVGRCRSTLWVFVQLLICDGFLCRWFGYQLGFSCQFAGYRRPNYPSSGLSRPYLAYV